MQSVGQWILEALKAPEDAATHGRIRSQIRQLCKQFPVPAAALEA
jgi:glycine hydroxymethyltransferase